VDEVVEIIEGLNLTSLPSATPLPVINQRLVDFQQLDVYPCVVVMAAGQETAESGTTGKDDIGYPVGIALLDRTPGEDVTLADTWTLWRQEIRNKFINQRQLNALNGFPSVYTCRWEPGQILEIKPLQYQKCVGSMILRFMSRETRGP